MISPNLSKIVLRGCLAWFAVDLVVCSALGVDMYDCVCPMRTARIDTSKHPGKIALAKEELTEDFGPLQEGCDCPTCKTYTRCKIYRVFE